MAARSGAVLAAAALAAIAFASCTLDREGTGELGAGTGGMADASVGGSAGTTELGGAGGSSAGGTGGIGGSSNTGGDGGTGAAGATGGAAGTAGQGGSATGGTGGIDGGIGGTSTGGTSTGGTSTGGTSTGGTSTGGAEAGTGDAGQETDCLNGLDDDQDGEVDCADDDCKALYECVPTAPSGWEGYFRVRELPWSDPPPPIEPCPDGSVAQRFYQDAAGPLVCVCGCGALSGAACSGPRVGCSANKTCNSPADWTTALSDGSCHKPDIGNSGSLSCLLLDTGTVANPGSCPPTVTKSSQEPFAKFVDVCGSTSGTSGCFPGYACAAKSGGAYAGLPCVFKLDNATCPAGWGARHFAFRSYTDTRNCSACSCNPQTSCAGGGYTVYDDNFCSSGGTSISDATCRDASGSLDFGTWSIKLAGGASASGQCVASGGASTGNLVTADPVTYCCQQ